MIDDVLENVPTFDDYKGLAIPMKQAEQIKTELYVRGLPWDMDNDGLKLLFKKYTPKYARSMKDMKSFNGTKSLGYGFVGFETEKRTGLAMQEMQGKELPRPDGEKIKLLISLAKARAPQSKVNDVSSVSAVFPWTLKCRARGCRVSVGTRTGYDCHW